jgi:hypothetical protein
MRNYLLVASVALVVVLTGCGPTATPEADPAGQTAPPTPESSQSAAPDESPTADDPAGFAAPAVDGMDGDWQGVHFASPDKNEGCAILGLDAPEPGLWGCALASQDWAFPSADPADYCYDAQVPCGYGIEATGDGAPHPRFRGDPGFPAAVRIFDTTGSQPQVSTLEYGHAVTYGDVTCVSATTGITCDNAVSGHGFTVSKAAYGLH